ncbi:bifunctional indole-3-glycerol-phosphate synthase TrpC/phosphoribosylanthranilate isomerase TrpF [Avibacterium sp. 21-599]|uniref:bifunctional indole-3-glycerol-phosphate synthase TrpC/phosphoribosylanthranilate isomerase TrpF n=1 Tax=Avibacterium sp. 21-599 TaxID=2911528 RepID=UPI0022470E6C|nr:bifunctional indole-3-glycerol-phosphate synthase TrpC/phosphoribosylanthranilate isomerase TrpF [Avibacterium sp. 21-599]MCW9716889.1 bifunctional indole-3-glycerol-phosphate synthase TrpC/phosphoribosylanthranilate isomerase TrpF [Avibacterium sp. 21-599]
MIINNQTPTILQKIVQDKAQWVEAKSHAFPLQAFEKKLEKSDRSFYQALAQGTHQRPAYILECKKASPSKGLIRADFNLDEIAQVYKHYAAAISVLTDEKYFQGDFAYIQQVRQQVTQPVLCKDFMISPYQVYLARYHQADAILLMLSVLDDETYAQLAELAHELGMGVLTETSNQQELERAIALGAKVIGINNRDLHDLSVDLDRTPPLARQIPADRIIISESGIYSHQQVQQLKPYVNGFLIGSSLMGSDDLNNAVRAVIFGENKVCGLTRPQDVQAVYQQGGLYGGLIFAETSKRKLSLRQAQELVTQAPLRFVGVFQNQQIDFIVKIASQLTLFAVQLHGSEKAEFIAQLRQQLPTECQIWQAISIPVEKQSAVQIEPISHIDRYVLDSQLAKQQGGTGQSFDWSLIPTEIKNKAMLAGGINQENVSLALSQHCLGLDINSGAESSAGVKDAHKLAQLFQQILDY